MICFVYVILSQNVGYSIYRHWAHILCSYVQVLGEDQVVPDAAQTSARLLFPATRPPETCPPVHPGPDNLSCCPLDPQVDIPRYHLPSNGKSVNPYSCIFASFLFWLSKYKIYQNCEEYVEFGKIIKCSLAWINRWYFSLIEDSGSDGCEEAAWSDVLTTWPGLAGWHPAWQR